MTDADQVQESREQREEIRRKTRRLPVLAVLATVALIIAAFIGGAAVVRTSEKADDTAATVGQINEEREARSIASAEAVLRSCANDNRQADYNDFLLNELVRSANRSKEPSPPEQYKVVAGLRKGIDALREDCREAPLVVRVVNAYPDALGQLGKLYTQRDAHGQRTIPYVPLH